MRIAASLLVLGFAAACGDNNNPGTPDASPDAPPGARCEPPSGPQPTSGALRDVQELGLEGCVEGGLRDLAGRWFMDSGRPGFAYEYPRFEGSCTDGFGRAGDPADDHDAADGRTYHTWSDGTRLYVREHFRFEFSPEEPPFEFVLGTAVCMRADGKLGGLIVQYTSDLGDISVPVTGTRIAARDDEARGLELVGEIGNQNQLPMPAYNVVVQGAYAYVVGPFGFDVVDVSNPEAPVHLSHLDGDYNDVRVVTIGGKTVAYASPLFSSPDTAVIDVTDPAQPEITALIEEYSHSVQIELPESPAVPPGLYLATYTNAVPRYDISNPLVPVRMGEATVPGKSDGVHDLTVAGGELYVNYTTGGMVALDVSAGLDQAVEIGRDPSTYSHASWVATVNGRRLVLHGDEGMTPEGGAYLRVLDGDPASPTYLQQLGRYQSRAEVGIHNFEIHGNRVYIAYYQDGVRVVDLSNPAAPQEVAHYNTFDYDTAPGTSFEGALGIRKVGDLIYVADSERGLVILRETP